MVKEIILIVKYETSGGKIFPHVNGGGELVAVVLDGYERKPKTSEVKIALDWLMGNDFEPVAFQWLDKAGYTRRRKQTYKKTTINLVACDG